MLVLGLCCYLFSIDLCLFVHGILQRSFSIAVKFVIIIDLLFFTINFLLGLNTIDNRDFPRLDIHCPRLEALVLSGHSGNIGMGIVLHTAIGKSSLETITAFGPCQCAIDLGGTLLSLHIYR